MLLRLGVRVAPLRDGLRVRLAGRERALVALLSDLIKEANELLSIQYSFLKSILSEKNANFASVDLISISLLLAYRLQELLLGGGGLVLRLRRLVRVRLVHLVHLYPGGCIGVGERPIRSSARDDAERCSQNSIAHRIPDQQLKN